METTMAKYVCRWNIWIAEKASLPGVWRRRDGGFLVRGRVRDPKTGKRTEVKFVIDDTTDAAVAFERLQAALREARENQTRTSRPELFADFATSLIEEKVNDGSVTSEATKYKWASVLKTQLIPAFGAKPVDQIRRNDVMEWRAAVAKQIRDDEYSPHTGNDWLALLRIILGEAVDRFELDHDPMRRVANFDTRAHRTYTREEPNSLQPEMVPRFLGMMALKFPQFLAVTTVGFATGLRPSSLRPLRRKGAHPDLLLSEGVLLVRRSHTEGQVAIDMTKTARDQEIVLPPDLIEVLKWHIETQLTTPKQARSDLLFPAEDGGFLHRNRLRHPFEVVCEALKLPFSLTPRGMRRTFQDLARAAQLHDFVTRAVSGHATEAMQKRYSTVSSLEVQQGLAKVIELTRATDALAAARSAAGRGAHRGAHDPDNEKAG